MLAAFRRQLAIEERLGSAVGRGRAHYRIAFATDDPAEKHTQLHLARTLLEKTPDKEYLGKTLDRQAVAMKVAGRLSDALDAASRAADLLLAADGAGLAKRFQPSEDRLDSSRLDALLGCAAYALELGHFEVAGTRQREARAVAKRLDTPWHVAEVEAFLHRIEAERAALDGRLDDAQTALERALPLLREYGPASALADTRVSLADLARQQGDLERAHVLAVEAVGFAEQLGGVHLGEAVMARGKVELDEGDATGARVSFVQARGLAEACGCLALEGDARLWLTDVKRRRAELGAALSDLEALRTWAVERGLPRLEARVAVELATMHAFSGRVDAADELLARAQAVFTEYRDMRGRRDAMRLRILVDVARGDRAAARRGAEALVRERASGRTELRDRLTLARVLYHLRDHQAEAEQWRKLVALGRRAQDRRLEERAACGLARALYWAAVHADAAAEERKAAFDALEAAQRVVLRHEDAEVRMQALLALAQACLSERQALRAMESARAGLDLVREFGLDLAEGEDAAWRGRYIAQLHDVGASAALEARDAERLYDFLERARASSLAALLGDAGALHGSKASEALRELRVREAEARARTSQARTASRRAQRRRDAGRMNAAYRQLAEAQKGLSDVLLEIRRTRRKEADLTTLEVTGIDELQQRLPARSAFVMFGAVERVFGKDAGPCLLAVRIQHGAKRPGTVIDLGPLPAVRKAIDALFAGDDAPVDAKAAAPLAKLLFEPLGIDKVERWIISPGDVLALVPFGMLAPTHDITLVPSATTYSLLHDREPKHAGSKILALGGVPYGASAGRRGMGDLPKSEAEARTAGDEGYELIGAHASETALYATLEKQQRWLALHFACHGVLDEHEALASYLALTGGQGNDGDLHVGEILDRTVPAKLVVLSACNTGQGKILAGEGLMGLSRAFLQAGAGRVICSLWKVDDDATAALMERFYKEWERGAVPAATALRRAQAHIAKQPQWKDPEYWAPWVLWGLPD